MEPTPNPSGPSDPQPRPGASAEDQEAPTSPVEAAANLDHLLDDDFPDAHDQPIAGADDGEKHPNSEGPGTDRATAAEAGGKPKADAKSNPESPGGEKKTKDGAAKPPRKRRWLRRVAITVAVLLGLALILRIAFTFAFPVALRKTAALYGLDCKYERFEFSALSGDAGLWHLTLTPKEGGEPVLQSEYVRGHISTLALLRGRLDVWRVEADGVDLNVDRTADGRLPLVDRFLGARQAKPAATPKEIVAGTGKIDLTPPLKVDALRLNRVRARVRDFMFNPPIEDHLDLSVVVSDVGSSVRPTRFEIEVACDPLLDVLRVEGEGRAAGETLDADIKVKLRGLRPRPGAPYLASMGIKPLASALSADMTGHLIARPVGQLPPIAADTTGANATTRPAESGPGTQPAEVALTTRPAGPAGALPEQAIAARLELKGISTTVDAEQAASLKRFVLEADTLSPTVVHVTKLAVEGGRAKARRMPDGTIQAMGLAFGPSPNPSAKSGNPLAFLALLPKGFHARLDELSVRDTRAEFVDGAVAPEADLAFAVQDFTIRDIVLDPKQPDAPLAIAGRFSSPGVARSIEVAGTARPFADRKTATVAVRADGVRPDAIRPYLDLFGVQSDLKDASLTCDLDAAVSQAPDGRWAADARLGRIALTDGQELLVMNGVRLDGVQIGGNGPIHVDSIEISGPTVSARHEPSGTLAAAGFRYQPHHAGANATAAKPAETAPVPHAAANRPSAPTAAPLADTRRMIALASADPSDAVQAAPAAPTEPTTSQAAPSTGPAAPQPTTGPAVAVATTAAVPRLPRIEVGRLVWKDIKARVEDQGVTPAAVIALSDAGIEVTDLKIDPEFSGPSQPGHFKAWLAAPDLAKQFELTGTITPGRDTVEVDATVVGDGLTTAAVETYLKPFGIEPVLKDGSLRAHVTATMRQTPDSIGGSLALDRVRYADGDQELAAVDGVRVDTVEYRKTGLAIESVEVDRPRARAERAADGTLSFAGVRLTGLQKPATQPAGAAPVVVASATAPAGAPPSTRPVEIVIATQPAKASPALAAVLRKLRVHNAGLTWVDHAVQPPVEISGTAGVEIDGLSIGTQGEAATLRLTASAPGSLENLSVTGRVVAAPDAPAARLKVSATGVRAGALAAYLPPGVESSLQDGRFQATIDTAIARHPEGGYRARLAVEGLDYRDGAEGPSLFKLDVAKAIVTRADLPDHALAVKELTATGVETQARRSPDGRTHAMGFTLGPATRPTTAPAAETPGAAPAIADAAAPTTQPPPVLSGAPALAAGQGSGASAEQANAGAAQLVAQSRKPLPLITVEKLDLNVRRATFTDEARPGSAPLTVADLKLHNLERIEWLGPDPAGRPPTKLEMTCRVEPLADSVKVGLQAQPFEQTASCQIEFAADGLHGDGLTALLPELRGKLDASALKDGRARGKLEAQAKLDRRTPIDFDPSRGFDLDFSLTGMEFRAAPDGPVLAGLEEIRSEGVRVRPATGDVKVRSLEITKPTFRAVREKDGIHALGMIVKVPAAGAGGAPATQPADARDAAVRAAAPVAAASTAPPTTPTTRGEKPKGEMRIDKLVISGADILVEDHSTEPPLALPIEGLEVEARDLSNLALYEPRPIRYSAVVNSGKITLPKKLEGGALSGALGDLSAVMKGKEVKSAGTEQRELFAQAAASGRLVLYPEIDGWTKASVSGLELAGLAGPAKQKGVDLSAGTFDAAVDARFRGGSLDSRNRFVFTDLGVTEPPDGPIFRFLHLPAPLDAVIGAMQAADGSITVPLDVPAEKGKLDKGAVVGSAVGAIGPIIATAIASTPVKAVTGVTGLLGLTADKKPAHEESVVLSFPAGYSGIEPAEQAKLNALLARLKKDPTLEITLKHELGGGDIGLAEGRANLTAADASALVYRLRDRKLDLQRLRGGLAAEARARLAAGSAAEAAVAMERVRALDRELAGTEDALDRVYELLRPGAERQASRRTRAAAIDVGRQRLEQTRAALLAAGSSTLPGLDGRIRVLNPQFNPAQGDAGGRVVITVVAKKK